jgi:hypothetical protein
MMNRRGFTAGELLAALTLIFIGSALVFHFVRIGPHAGRMSACASNVRQLANALIVYAGDYEGHMPPAARPWPQVMPYIKNWQIMQCPAAPYRDGPDKGGDYLVNYRLQTDDRPGELLVGEDEPDRHWGKRWAGARLDGACFWWPASEWEAKMKWVSNDEARTR